MLSRSPIDMSCINFENLSKYEHIPTILVHYVIFGYGSKVTYVVKFLQLGNTVGPPPTLFMGGHIKLQSSSNPYCWNLVYEPKF